MKAVKEKPKDKPKESPKPVQSSPKPAPKPAVSSSPKPAPQPKPGKAALAYSAGNSSPRSAGSAPAPEVVKPGLHSTTYEKQPDWAYSERDKNASGQYRDGKFQGSDNPNNARSTSSSSFGSPKPAQSSVKPTTSSTSSYSSPKTSTYSSFNKPASSGSSPSVASYRAGGSGNSSSSYGAANGGNHSSAVTKSGLHQTTYEKQPDWAYSERHKNANGQYKDSMFQSGSGVTYGQSSASPSELRARGNLN